MCKVASVNLAMVICYVTLPVNFCNRFLQSSIIYVSLRLKILHIEEVAEIRHSDNVT